MGNGAKSPESDEVIPAPTAPMVPVKPTGWGGDGYVWLSWSTVPDGDGGTAITRWWYSKKEGNGVFEPWRIICLTDNDSTCPSTTSHTVTGLTNGTAYRFKVRASNVLGVGAASPESDVITAGATAPLAPTKPNVTAGHQSVTLSWSTVTHGDGGDAITQWQYVQKEEGAGYGTWIAIPTSTASTTSHKVTDLSNGRKYHFKVRAVNGIGIGAASPESDAVTPVVMTVPQAPSKPHAIAGDASITLTWSSGGAGASPISQWQYVTKEGTGGFGTDWVNVPGGAGARSFVVTELGNGTAYQFKIRAANSFGPSAASPASDVVTPSAGAGVELTASRVKESTATLTIVGYDGDWLYRRKLPAPVGDCRLAPPGSMVNLSGLSAGNQLHVRSFY